MKLVVLIIMATYVAAQQAPVPAILADNQVIRAHLVGTKPTCTKQDSFAKALNLINNEGNLVFVTSAKRLLKSNLANFKDIAVVYEALFDANANPGVAQQKTSSSEWNADSPVRANVQMAFAATSGDDHLDYYYFRYDLNIQGKVDYPTEQYISALAYLACVNTNEWIDNYAATKSN